VAKNPTTGGLITTGSLIQSSINNRKIAVFMDLDGLDSRGTTVPLSRLMGNLKTNEFNPIPNPMRILLIGYYGKYNFGDDLFVRQLCTVLSAQPSIKAITVLCDTDYYDAPSGKVSYLPLKQVNKLKRIQLIAQHDAVVWGGGTLAINEPPTTILRMQAIAKLWRKPFVFLGVGLEGIGESCRQQGIQVFKNAQTLYVRDQYSYKFAHEILGAASSPSPSGTHLCLGGDLAFLDLSLYQGFMGAPKNRTVGTAIQHLSMTGIFWWGDSRAEFYAQQIGALVEKYGTHIHLLPAQQSEELNDNEFHRRLMKYLPSGCTTLYEWTQVEEYINVLSQMDMHLGNRLHSIIMAEILGVPSMGIGAANGKIANFLDKSQVLSQERLYDFMQPIPLARFEQVYWEYQHPQAFIQAESLAARQGINAALGISCAVDIAPIPIAPITPNPQNALPSIR
jgi:polysaccharide pyruvyl transferase WcaK-like protein